MATYIPAEAQTAVDKHWMRLALSMAQEAYDASEIPVGCVFVEQTEPGTPLHASTNGYGRMIAKSRNRTNELRNATLHAELEAIGQILREQDHKLLHRTTLYVTIEPCIMCASALRQVGINHVVYGAGNERFGGCGSVVPINDEPLLKYQKAYTALGGVFRDEAIMLLRRFYMTENSNAPQPRKKQTRILKTEIPPVPPTSRMHTPNGSVVPSPSITPTPIPPQTAHSTCPPDSPVPVSFTPTLENV
ncbi:hypothetical protein E3P99_00662 [Wallemia hederae]|uniref:CMP/dCMP-type deaminase domain-containing protein n=1 Tax=Wallemia hederae TaxID=1540922 RepID=A0A4V4LU22_9BASI|nr:hypothetical protein E3P99_00662 [Wallemia hederae]